jgi:poly(A)-specific ribonuclease
MAAAVHATVPVKQVTAANFSASLPALRALIAGAAFVAVDTEMTGLSAAPWHHASAWDSSAVRFLKLRHAASRFALLQFGLCPFVSQSDSSLIAHPHTFHLFPSADSDFLCQNASLHFLSSHRFDFNSCLTQGLSFLSRAQEQRLLLSNSNSNSNSVSNSVSNSPQSTADLLFSQRIKISLHHWTHLIANATTQRRTDITSSNFGNFHTTLYKMRPALLLHGYTSHQLNLIQHVLLPPSLSLYSFPRNRAGSLSISC